MSDSQAAIWSSLAAEPEGTGWVRRRVIPDSGHDVFFGESRPSRSKRVIMTIYGKPEGLPRRRTSSRGLEVGLQVDSDQVTVQLTSNAGRGGDPMFTELADDVVRVLAAQPGQGAAARVLERVVAWQSFFAAARDRFSSEAAAGLFAELITLRDLFLPALGPSGALSAWHGPDPAVQDFLASGTAVEVKSFRGNGDGQLRITSERQLDEVGVDQLFVAYIRLDERADGTGMTLAELILDIATNHLPPDTHLAFEDRLMASGWHRSLADTRPERFLVRSQELLHVREGFPRIVPSQLPTGMRDVSYCVERSALEPFVTPWASLIPRLEELPWQ
ncbi:PD-(D/E)XK motif protein [Propioniciclava sp. MC1595]|uniref:PD-(D/E)XK motif protein n=1 Tax=Propioniciclava sp. MC1595 TaxID=2760308 RepID=UPI0016622060|nr:PD-(D/E)XK motif protein [Propioniciclava sp. MC1595]MBB1496117.1 PD-(D/E)XK motif protein [Propioniciclava sp. MC1595]QTE26396.1 PD-(D/E)XK motif protein [Propioniciclava sp. MC1595]